MQDFRADPGWEGYRNRLAPDPPRITRQDFGYRATTRVNARPGEIGGWVQRALSPASYALKIPPRTLNDRLSASGRFAVTRDDGSSGVLFGWFNDTSRGWRTPNSLAFRLDGNGGKYWVFYEYGTRNWLSGGAGCFEGERYQTTPTKPFRADGSVHEWTLTYDPEGAGGRGELTFVLDGTRYVLALAPGHRADGATFDRFGILNQMTTGSGMEAYFDDLVLDGNRLELDREPRWEGRGNQGSAEDRLVRPFHQFGYSRTKHAGGGAGEVGGLIWRDERPAYYADRVGSLGLEDELSASGRLVFTGAGSDSGVYLGWFDAATKQAKAVPEHQERQKNLLAILIEGPSRVGHYFRPAYATRAGEGAARDTGPLIRPDGRVHRWSLRYSPTGANGRGQITATLDGQARTLDLQPGHRGAGATFDRFGFCNVQSGGHYVEVYVDDLQYTTRAGGS